MNLNVDGAGKSGFVRMKSETCLNEALTFVMLNRWVVKININFRFIIKHEFLENYMIKYYVLHIL